MKKPDFFIPVLVLLLAVLTFSCGKRQKTSAVKTSPQDTLEMETHDPQEKTLLLKQETLTVRENQTQSPVKNVESAIQPGTVKQKEQKQISRSSDAGIHITEDYSTQNGRSAYEYYHTQPLPVPQEPYIQQNPYQGQESYDLSTEQDFQRATEHPLSTFSIDVDNASYTNTRRILQSGTLPPKEAVRIEEFINYFTYQYAQPSGPHPFGFHSDLAPCPWNPQRYLLRVAMKGKEIPFQSLPPMNLTFLIDVSGSMNAENRLPLLKRSLRSLTEKLRPQDQVSIVVYAGAAGLVLPCTPGNDKIKILDALDKLSAGGSTAGGQGLELAYKTTIENFKKEGINRIILASDGDFNVGRSSDEDMKKLIEEKRKSGVNLTVLGFGMGNLKDSKMEILADHGNGNYFYIDSYEESMRVLVDRIDGTLYSLAADVKLQLEFNPAKVKYFRLIGYDNRRLNKEDFNNDKKDAGELGAGHTVTALYEIIPAGSSEEPAGTVDALKYGSKPANLPQAALLSPEWLTLKFRYKTPGQENSKLISHAITSAQKSDKMSEDFKFCAAVTAFGMILKDSEHKGSADYRMVEKLASESLSKDPGGYRAEFIRLVKMAESLGSMSTGK